MSCPIVEVHNLSKCFARDRPWRRLLLAPLRCRERTQALCDVSLAVAPGEILGIVGPNGAGKTTLLRIMADLLEADTGSVRLGGRELSALSHPARECIGYVSNDERSFFWRLTGMQNLEFFACLYGLPRAVARRRIGDLLEQLGLEKQSRQLFRDYSSGTRKKFALVRALLHEPRLLLLDEVTNSLDPPSAQSIKRLVKEYVSSGPARAGVWSTHRLEEIGELCDQVLVLDQGYARFLGAARGILPEPRWREMAVSRPVT
jgi:ABC-2 type transport system ATP-binding protein